MMNLFLFAAIFIFISTTTISAKWLGPYDTHDPHSVWLRSVMETKSFLRQEQSGFNILNFNATPSVRTQAASFQNGDALYHAILAANTSIASRTVIIPVGLEFWMMPTNPFQNIFNVTLQFDGNISAFPDNQTAWPETDLINNKIPLIFFYGGSDITVVGNGAGCINGHGFSWWESEFRKPFGKKRPVLIEFDNVQRVVISDVKLYDSPRYHINLRPVFGGLVQRVTISVDVFKQYSLHKKYGTLLHNVVDFPITFPLNTDGIDFSGNTIVVRDSFVENFDDSYCPKPSPLQSAAGCTHNLLITNSTQQLGIGSSVGSVPPRTDINCVQNVTFDNINWKYAVKAIYVKPNPGDDGVGIIRDITYKNSHGLGVLWWSIFVSTQQQEQPGSTPGKGDTGCSFLYPLPNTSCPTQPRVPVTNLFIDNVTFDNSLLSPGILRCNDTNVGSGSGPCTGWVWTNVQMNSILKWPIGDNFLCHAIENPIFTNVSPTCTAAENTHHHILNKMMMQHHQRHYNDEDDENTEVNKFLDELGLMMKSRGISLWNVMKMLHP